MANTITYDELIAMATDLGKDAGRGSDTQGKLLLKTLEASYHGVIDLKANKYGHEVDDAVKITETYVKARQANVVFDHKAPNQRKTASCVRTYVKLGGWTKGGNGEPIATVNNLVALRQKLRANPLEAPRLDDMFNTLMKFGRAQLKQDTLIPDDQLRDFCYKPGQNLLSPEEIIEGLVKRLDKLISGEASSGTACDKAPEIINARDQLRKRLSAIAKARGAAKGPSLVKVA